MRSTHKITIHKPICPTGCAALKHLNLTNEITIKTTSKFTIITINKYSEYQHNPYDIANTQLTDEQQATNKQLTNNQQQYKKNKNNKKNKKARIYNKFDDERIASYSLDVFEEKSLFKD